MDFIVDANVAIAALISRSGHTADLFFSPMLSIYAPELLLHEIWKHKEELIIKTGLSATDFGKALAFLSAKIKLFPVEEFLPSLPRAKEVCPDPDDVPYLALALHLGCPLWSNDKELKKQSAVKVLSTSEVLALLKGKRSPV